MDNSRVISKNHTGILELDDGQRVRSKRYSKKVGVFLPQVDHFKIGMIVELPSTIQKSFVCAPGLQQVFFVVPYFFCTT